MVLDYTVMILLEVLVLSAIILDATASEDIRTRNTIFNDEKLEGGPFKNLDNINDVNNRESASAYRLPTTTKPQHYDLLWDINMANRSFAGTVDIHLYATQPNVNEIVLHAHDLSITSLNLYKEDVEIYQTHTLQPAYHFLRVLLTNGTLDYNATDHVLYRLTIGFKAPLRTDMTGLYESWFKNSETDEERWIAVTFFAPTYARFAFPCYDEPSFKATFQVTVRRPAGYNSWSNTQLKNTTDSTDGYKNDLYFPTPKMSTYIVAIVVAEYESTHDGDDVVIHEVIARRSAIDTRQAEYADDVGLRILEATSAYTGIEYISVDSNLKMSHVAIPDFSAGAMENWGLVSYRENNLLYDVEETSKHFKHIVARLLAHEIAHMWFGNLVTCDWWDVVWLNEGFARYYEYYIADKVERDVGYMSRFVPEQVHTSLLSDSANNPHPLSNTNVGSPDEAWAMFSTITYNKGASVIRMTEHLLGEQVYIEGIRRYLKNRHSETGIPDHLYHALQEVADEYNALSIYGPEFNFTDYFKTWTDQGGHPVLYVDVNHSTGQMTVLQRRFNINSGHSTATRNWIIPINFAAASSYNFSDTKPTHIIKGSVSVLDRNSTGDQWTIFNKQQIGFYRVNYDDYTWTLNTIQLKSNKDVIHEFNRAQIVDDVFQFARSGIMNYTKTLTILSYLVNEDAYTPWAAAIAGFNWLSNRFVGTDLEAQLNNLFKQWAAGVMTELTYEPTAGESFSRMYLRYQLAPVMCRLEDPLCREAARHQFNEFRVNGTRVHKDNRNWVYCNGLRDGTWEDFDKLWDRYLSTNVYSEKVVLLTALGCTRNATSLNKFLDEIIKDQWNIRPQDYTTAFNSAVTGNQENTQIVFEYIKNNLQAVIDAFGTPTTPLSYISSRLRTRDEVQSFREWAISEQATLGTSFQAINNSAQTALNALEWADEVKGDISNYFSSGGEQLETSTAAVVTSTDPDTVTPPPIEEPSTPELEDGGDSANVSHISILLLVGTLIVNFITYK